MTQMTVTADDTARLPARLTRRWDGLAVAIWISALLTPVQSSCSVLFPDLKPQ